MGPAKLGLLSYIVEGWRPEERDVVFVPVGLAYDRVLEDRVLVGGGEVRGAEVPQSAVLGGDACAAISVGALARADEGLWHGGGGVWRAGVACALIWRRAARWTSLGERLMAAIAAVVPVLPVPLVAAALGAGAASRDELLAADARRWWRDCRRRAQCCGCRRRGWSARWKRDLAPLIARGLVRADLTAEPREAALLAFYAASVPVV